MAHCEFSYKKGGSDDTVRCTLLNKNGDCCGNVKFCRMTRHWENSDQFKNCPVRLRGIAMQNELTEGKENG